MMGNLSIRKVVASIGLLAVVSTIGTGMARDINDDAPFGPGGAEYHIPDPTPMFLLQAPIKTDLARENPLNAVPAGAELLAYSGNMTQMHENFAKTQLGKLAESKTVDAYLGKILQAFEEDFANGDGSFSDAQVKERRLEWKMYKDFYASANHEFTAFVYWTRGREEPNMVFIAAANTGTELNATAGVLRDYFNKRREMNTHLSVVDRTHKTRKSANAIKQINSDQTVIDQEAYCVRNNLVIFAKGSGAIDDVLDRLDNPDQSILAKGRFEQMFKQASVSAEVPPDLMITVRLNNEVIRRLPEDLQANVQQIVAATPGQEISAAAGIHFDAKTGKLDEKVFLATGPSTDTPAPTPAVGGKPSTVNNFLIARLLDPSRTAIYATTAGDVDAWTDVFARERLFGNGVPRWLTTPAAREALGGEMAIVYYTRDRSPEMSDYLRQVVIMEIANPAKLDAWQVAVKASCGDGFSPDVNIPVTDTIGIVAQHLINPNDKATENIGRSGWEALVERNLSTGTVSAEQGRMPLNFFPAYAVVPLMDDQGQMHSYLLCGYSVATLRLMIANMKQIANLAATRPFQDRVEASSRDFSGVFVFVNSETILRFLKDDLLALTSEQAKGLNLGNVAVTEALQQFGMVYDYFNRIGEPSSFKGYRIKDGFLIEGSSYFGQLAPLGLIQGYGQLALRKREYARHAMLTRAKMQKIKVALDLYHSSALRYPTRDSLPDLKQYLKTDEYSANEREFNAKQTAEFLRVFSFMPGNALLADVEQVKQPQTSGLVYVEGVDERSLGDAVILYEARPTGEKGSFFALHRDGRINTMTARELAAALPEPDKIHNPYSPGLVRALETAAEK